MKKKLALLVLVLVRAMCTAQNATTVNVENLTKSINILSVNSNGTEATVIFQNTGEKRINACKLSAGNTGALIEFYFPDQDGLAPGAQFTQTIPLSNPSSTIVVSAALLEGGIGEGDATALRDIRERRRGYLFMMQKAIASFVKYAEADEPPEASIDKIKKAIDGLSETGPNNEKLTVGELQAMRAGKVSMLSELESVAAAIRNNADPNSGRSSIVRLYQIHLRRLKLLQTEQNEAQ